MKKGKGRLGYSSKLKRKISTMQLGKIYYDKVLKNKKEMFGK